MTVWLARNRFPGVSQHTVDRLMRLLGMRGLVRGRQVRTTVPAPHGARRATDLLQRCFTAPRPNHAWVTDFTYVATSAGFVYVAFAIDLCSRAVVGWSAATVKDTAFVEACLAMALWRRQHTCRPVPAGSSTTPRRSSACPGSDGTRFGGRWPRTARRPTRGR